MSIPATTPVRWRIPALATAAVALLSGLYAGLLLLGTRWALLAPTCSGLGALALVATGPSMAGRALLIAAYFTGTVLYVKTMIRERGNTTYHRASIGYHVAAVALAAWLSLPLLGVFLLLLVRATVLPRHRLTPKQVGIIEILASALVLLSLTLPGGTPLQLLAAG